MSLVPPLIKRGREITTIEDTPLHQRNAEDEHEHTTIAAG
jgi:hypothetical protein